jgi:uncharacterized OsmC-like protein
MSATKIREAIDNMGRLISEQPEKARAKHAAATARLVEDLRCEVKGPHGETVLTDMPPAMGGAASAPSPGWLLRASLASCTATTIAMRAAKLGIQLTTLEVTVDSSADHRGFLGLDDKVSAGLSPITMRVKVGASGVAADKLRDLVDWGDRHSPVGCTARESPAFALEVEVV